MKTLDRLAVMKHLSDVPELSDALKKTRTEQARMEEHRRMSWEDFWSAKLTDALRKQARANDESLHKQLERLKHLVHDHDRWLCALDKYYFFYLQHELTSKTKQHIEQFLLLSNSDGLNVLHRAVLAENTAFAQFLLHKGASPCTQSRTGRVGLCLRKNHEANHTDAVYESFVDGVPLCCSDGKRRALQAAC